MKVYLVYSCYNDHANIWKNLEKIFLNKQDAEEHVELNNYQIDKNSSGNCWFEYQEWKVNE